MTTSAILGKLQPSVHSISVSMESFRFAVDSLESPISHHGGLDICPVVSAGHPQVRLEKRIRFIAKSR
jgi:hypothetical protein